MAGNPMGHQPCMGGLGGPGGGDAVMGVRWGSGQQSWGEADGAFPHAVLCRPPLPLLTAPWGSHTAVAPHPTPHPDGDKEAQHGAVGGRQTDSWTPPTPMAELFLHHC